jgi:hypothetical protein
VKRPRHRPSSIDRLDPEIKAMIGTLRIEHGWTIDEILQRLVELNQPVSRSALARHTKSIEEIGAELRHSREMAKALVEQTDGAGEHRLSDLNLELMHSMVLRLVTATNAGEMVTFQPKDVMFLSASLSSLAATRKADADRRRKDREEAKREMLEAVKKAAGQPGSGLTKATVDEIYHAVLGVAPADAAIPRA